jgi:hypothetical protein
MPKKERIRESMSSLPTLEHLVERVEAGWKLAAIEWEREAQSSAPAPPAPPATRVIEQIPFGLRVSDDCSGLEEDPAERQMIVTALDMIVDDCPLSQVSDELNRRGHKTRDGAPWTPTALFVLLPRMIEVGPRVFSTSEWSSRKQRLPRVV